MMLLFLLALIVIPSQALYFYMDGSQAKCFFEDLPKDTLVVGTHSQPKQGNSHYSTWN